MQSAFIVVFCTVPDQESARKIARTVVEEHLAACCNIVPGLTSLYFWEGKLQEDAELLLIIKTRREAFEKLQDRIAEIHPYSVPEIIALPVEQGNPAYLSWVEENVH